MGQLSLVSTIESESSAVHVLITASFLLVLGCSGYDFGYLLKLLTASPLPPIESEFFDALHIWFPHVYDIKHIMRSVRSLKGGLQEIADMMNVSGLSTRDLPVSIPDKNVCCSRCNESDLNIKPDPTPFLLRRPFSR